MSSISTGFIQTTNLTVTGTQAGAVAATNFNTQNVNTGNVTLTGKLICSSNNVVQTLVKGVPVTTDNSAFADMLATTQNGRIALAKALNYGTSGQVFEVNGYKPLLDAGYSGKGVIYGHFETPMQFHVPHFRHLVHPQHLYSTSNASFDALQNLDRRINTPLSPHVYGTCGFVAGFDLHAKLTDKTWFQVGFGEYNIANPDAFVMGAAYNADVISIEQFPEDTQFYTDNPGQLELFDDVWVEVMEKAFMKGVKVGQAATTYVPGRNGSYYQIDTSGPNFTGVNNPLSYIASLAADNDMVYCESAGNNVILSAFLGSAVPSPGSGYMMVSTDARNILSVGAKLVNDGTVYPLVAGYTGTTISSVDNIVIDKDYVQINYYVRPSDGARRSTPAAGYTNRQLAAYHGFGRTVDTAGPGATHRCKPDIISAQGGTHHYLYWPSERPGLKSIYGTLINGATSGTAPTLAGGVCLLREALPLYDAHQIRECIMLSASNGDLSDADTDLGLGYGLVNLGAALAYGQARPQKPPPSFVKGTTWTYGSAFLASIAAGALDTLNVYQPFRGGNNFTPKSVQSFKCPKDASLSANTAYQTAYAAYETAYNAYVASASQLWTAGVLDLSPPKGLWGTSSTRDISIDGPIFSVTSNRSWIAVSDEDVQEIKDLMIANGIKVCVTSKSLGAFSVLAESPEQLAAVVNGNSKILNVMPVVKLVMSERMPV
jgi:hypothetical protein